MGIGELVLVILVGNERRNNQRRVASIRAVPANAILPDSPSQVKSQKYSSLPTHIPKLLVVIVPGRASWPLKGLKGGRRHQYSLSCARCGITEHLSERLHSRLPGAIEHTSQATQRSTDGPPVTPLYDRPHTGGDIRYQAHWRE